MDSSITALWRYPIKSMPGESLSKAVLHPRGMQGDRVYALQEVATGNIVSGKNPRKWGRLFTLRAAVVESSRNRVPEVQITFPDGSTVTTNHQDIDHWLSDYLGREVISILIPPPVAQRETYWLPIDGMAFQDQITTSAFRAPHGTFFDFAAIHLVTTNTLRYLHALYPTGQFAVERFRPNLVIEVPARADGFIENEWVGRILTIGETVRLRVLLPTPRCVVTTLPQGTLPQDPGILRTAVHHNFLKLGDAGTFACVGAYAEVLQGGVMAVGDRVRVE